MARDASRPSSLVANYYGPQHYARINGVLSAFGAAALHADSAIFAGAAVLALTSAFALHRAHQAHTAENAHPPSQPDR